MLRAGALLSLVVLIGCGEARAQASEQSALAPSSDFNPTCDYCPGAASINFQTSRFADGGVAWVDGSCTCSSNGHTMSFTASPLMNPCGTVYACDPATIDPCAYTQCMFAALCANDWAKESPPRCFPDGGLPP